MSEGAFQRVFVPVEFESAKPGEVPEERAVQIGDGDLVALGGCTIAALELAAKLAKGGQLWLVHATTDFRNHVGWMSAAQLAELDRGAARQAKTVLDAIAAKHCPGVQVHHVLRAGRALDVILEAADEHQPDAIVLAASSRGRVHRAFLGSTADKIIRQSTCPVVVVPSGTQ